MKRAASRLFIRDIATVGGATLISRLLGFARDVGIAAALGTGVFADAFFAVLQLTNFFRRLLAEGALNAAFVPVWLRIKATESEESAFRFFRGVFEGTALIAVPFSLIGIFFAESMVALVVPGFTGERAEVAANYLHVAAPYVALAALIAVFAALLNAENRVRAVSLGIVVFNAVVLLALALVFFTGALLPLVTGALLAQAIVVGGLAQFAVIFVAFLRMKRPPMLGHALAMTSETWRFFLLAVPGLVAAGIPQLKLIAGAMVASSSQAGVSWLYYANRLYELPLGVASIAIATVIAPRIAASVLSGNRGEIAHAQSRALEIALGIALPAAAGFAVLSGLIASGLFERGAFEASDSAAVAAALAAICAGLPGHVTEKVFGAISFAHEDTRTPMLTALTGLAFAIAAALFLFPRYGHVGVAAAIAMSGWVGAAILGVIVVRRRWIYLDSDATRRLPLIVSAAAIMAAAIWIAQRYGGGWWENSSALRLMALAALVTLGVALYLGALDVMRVARIKDVLRALRRG
jgi:putative peptidoglycan lipid II flippase